MKDLKDVLSKIKLEMLVLAQKNEENLREEAPKNFDVNSEQHEFREKSDCEFSSKPKFKLDMGKVLTTGSKATHPQD